MMGVLLNKNKKLLRVPSLSAPQRKSDQNMKTVTSSITHKWDKAESLENMERGWWKYDKKQFDKWKLVLCSFLPALFWPWGEGQRDLILKPMTVFWLLLQRYLAFLHFFFPAETPSNCIQPDMGMDLTQKKWAQERVPCLCGEIRRDCKIEIIKIFK